MRRDSYEDNVDSLIDEFSNYYNWKIVKEPTSIKDKFKLHCVCEDFGIKISWDNYTLSINGTGVTTNTQQRTRIMQFFDKQLAKQHAIKMDKMNLLVKSTAKKLKES